MAAEVRAGEGYFDADRRRLGAGGLLEPMPMVDEAKVSWQRATCITCQTANPHRSFEDGPAGKNTMGLGRSL